MKARILLDGHGRYWRLQLKCPAGHTHEVGTDWTPLGVERSPYADEGGHWHFDGNLEAPTLSPSILMRQGHFCHEPPVPGNCACDFTERFPEEDPWEWPCCRCHSFVKAGKIQFLADCSHELAGKTVDLLEVDP